MKKALLFSVLLFFCWLCGTGCCTYYANKFARKCFRKDTMLLERIGRISEDKQSFIVNVNTDTIHCYWPNELIRRHSPKSSTFSFSLIAPPAGAKTIIIDMEVLPEISEHDRMYSRGYIRKFSSDSFNKKFIEKNNVFMKVPVEPLTLDSFTVTLKTDAYDARHYHIKMCAQDIPELNIPFLLQTNVIKVKRNETQFVDQYNELLIPYKREGNRLFVYSATCQKDNSILFDQNIKCTAPIVPTYILLAAIIPQAIVIDIITCPFQAIGMVFYAYAFGAALSSIH